MFEAHKFLHISNEKINNQISFYWIRLLPKLIKKITTISNKKKNIKIKPIFIVGLPRSGSTLVESIISSGKKKLQIGGETSILNRVFLEENSNFLSKKEFLEENKEMKINIDSFNENSLKKYELLNLLDKQTNYIFTDKSLENFFFIELIIKIFPEAKIINCERNIFQIIISIYQNFLSNIKWSNSIDNILEYIDNYLKIISEFKKKYPKHIYNIDLDKLTKNSQKESKALFKFCNLDWDLKCLEFYKRKDLISKTASNQQVRNKIFINEKKYTEYKVFFKPYADKYAWLEKIIQPNKENN